MTKGHLVRFCEPVGRNVMNGTKASRNHCGGQPTGIRGKAASVREASDAGTGRLHRAIGDGIRAIAGPWQHRKPRRRRTRANRESARTGLGRAGGEEARRTGEWFATHNVATMVTSTWSRYSARCIRAGFRGIILADHVPESSRSATPARYARWAAHARIRS